MAYEDRKLIAERRKYLSGIATKTVVDYLLFNKSLSAKEKMEVLRIARSMSPHRITWEDFCRALREWRKKKVRE